jgi:BirA family transcriptional regulator, biotin operon repressor / biotin---[acetyl-CoA-carboxylase] ligase
MDSARQNQSQSTGPNGVPVIWLDQVDSTSSEAARRAASGERGPLWIVARSQVGGRGRSGRQWASPPGNLYSSYLMTSSLAAPQLTQLSLVAGLAVHEAVDRMLPGRQIALKWPNDVLVEGAKVSGVLIESQPVLGNHATSVVIGIGLNLAHHPTIPGRSTISLSALGAEIPPERAFLFVAKAVNAWFAVWSEGTGFSAIREAWLRRSLNIGSRMSVWAAAQRLQGYFAGLADDGAMVLALDEGGERRITFGDGEVGEPPRADG